MHRLELIPVTRHHARDMFGILADPRLYQFTGGQPHENMQSVQDWFAALETRESPDGKERWLTWIVRLREQEVLIGYVQATIKGLNADVAWLIGTNWQGQGYAKEAVAILKSRLEVSNIERISACIHPYHRASQKVASSMGLRRTGDSDEGEEIWAAPLFAT